MATTVSAVKVHYVIVYRRQSGDWYWRARARNGRILADGSEGYKRLGACLAAMQGVTNASLRGIPVHIAKY